MGSRFGRRNVAVVSTRIMALALSLILANAASAQRAYEIRALLASSDDFGSRVSVKNDIVTGEAIHEVELCLTSVCDMFELRGAESLENLTAILDFALFFLLYASNYADLTASAARDSEAADLRRPPIDFIVNEYQRGAELLDLYGDDCRVGTEAERARCVITDMLEQHNIRAYSVRYDQGFRVVTPSSRTADRLSGLSIDQVDEQLRWINSYR